MKTKIRIAIAAVLLALPVVIFAATSKYYTYQQYKVSPYRKINGVYYSVGYYKCTTKNSKDSHVTASICFDKIRKASTAEITKWNNDHKAAPIKVQPVKPITIQPVKPAKPIVDPTVVLKEGDKGEKVKQLQRDLNTIGNYKLTVDGTFGSKTKTAVTDFQKKNSLKATGAYTKETQTKLLLILAAKKRVKTPVKTTVIAKKGDKGPKVTQLQKDLNFIMGTKINSNGVFTGETESILKNFQTKYGITPVDGVLTSVTQAKVTSVKNDKLTAVKKDLETLVTSIRDGDVLTKVKAFAKENNVTVKIDANGQMVLQK